MTIGGWAGRAAVVLGLSGAAIALILLPRPSPERAAAWERQASPGRLSAAHASLENNCAACHTPARGPDASKCIACHANDEALLQRQPTAFHGRIGSCRECHIEHRGVDRHPTEMDHAALAEIVLRPPVRGDLPNDGDDLGRKQILAWLGQADTAGHLPYDHPGVTAREAALDCSSCHSTKDRHVGFFGRDCAECHATSAWTIPEFRHPSPRSTECVQCHRAPPCHYMPSFFTACAKLAGKPNTRVDQCFSCHQTTSWNDIKGVGFCMHH